MTPDDPKRYAVGFRTLDKPFVTPLTLGLAIHSEAPAIVFVVPLQGSVAIRTMSNSEEERDALITDIVDRRDVGEQVRALLAAAVAARDETQQ